MTQELYTKFAYEFMPFYRNLNILSVIGLSEAGIADLPSWVPYWTRHDAVPPIVNATSPIDMYSFYHVSGSSVASPRKIHDTLILSGYVYDTILDIRDTLTF